MKRFFLLIFTALCCSNLWAAVWTIAIDPGHGGKDPGAVGRNLHIYEKNVTLSIAKELKALLDKDPNFRGVLTRTGDYYISVSARSEIARRNRANYLISIHADSSLKTHLRGASVWVLSNRRANDEMGQWLEDHEKQSELLGGAGKVLSNSKEVYLNQTVLDLQFGHSQRVGYELGNHILRNFAKITELSRSRPRHASLGVLRSPDIPSVLVETGFLSNKEEEAKLSTLAYRKRVAYMIYQSLIDYRRRNIGAEASPPSLPSNENQADSSKQQQSDKKAAQSNESKNNESKSNEIKDSGIRHKVKAGESLGGLARKYDVKVADIVALNKLKRQALWIGESIKIPDNGKTAVENPSVSDKANQAASKNTPAQKKADKQAKNEDKKAKSESKNKSDQQDKKQSENHSKAVPKFHIMQKNQTIYAVGRLYGIAPDKILKLNPKLKNGQAREGQKIQLKE